MAWPWFPNALSGMGESFIRRWRLLTADPVMAPNARELSLMEVPRAPDRPERRAKKALNFLGVMDGARFCLACRRGGEGKASSAMGRILGLDLTGAAGPSSLSIALLQE
ncbi:hypothetical protein VSDG_06353 [Cytospora chrysosperma]|uniref:Uncharacterized protein n=1 Tax=Cytospora chrysosperma TaxID=252740 RepID=A0A423VPD9_CYTCH|nr:hypothetical protein VSDG_06353 [Valsa sordida]